MDLRGFPKQGQSGIADPWVRSADPWVRSIAAEPWADFAVLDDRQLRTLFDVADDHMRVRVSAPHF
jgi:hypothetical protein